VNKLSWEHYKASLNKKVEISIHFKGREYTISTALRDVTLCFEPTTLKFDQSRISGIMSKLSFYGDEADGDDILILEKMLSEVERVAFEHAKKAAVGLYREYKKRHQRLYHFHRNRTPGFSEDVIKTMTIDNPADLQVLSVCVDDMVQDVAQAWVDENEAIEAKEKVKALAARVILSVFARLHGVRKRTSFRGLAHKNKVGSEDDDAWADNSLSHPHLTLHFPHSKPNSTTSPRRRPGSCGMGEGGRAA
jgi:hypothetical protein